MQIHFGHYGDAEMIKPMVGNLLVWMIFGDITML